MSSTGRKRLAPSAPVYSPNETLNQMTAEAEARQQDAYTVQKEARAIRAKELEKQRKEDEEENLILNNSVSSSRIKIETEFDEQSDDDNLFIQSSSSSSKKDLIDEERDDEYNNNNNNHISSTTNNILITNTNGHHSNTNGKYAASVRTTPTLPTTSLNGSGNIIKSRFLSSTTTLKSTNDLNDSQNSDENPRELKKKISEMEEKYKKQAMYQTELENNNQKLIYEVDSLKDLIEEFEERHIEINRIYKEKNRELENQKRTYKDLATDFERLKKILEQRDALIEDSGLILYTDNELKSPGGIITNGNGKQLNGIKSVLPAALVSSETAKLLDTLGEGTIDDKLKKLLDEKQEFKEQISKLKSDLEDERYRNTNLEKKIATNANKLNDNQESNQGLHEMQRAYTKEINELKLKFEKVEHENILLKQEKTRLDTQLKNLQRNFEEVEQNQTKLDKEKREFKKELNEAKSQINDYQTRIDVLTKTLERKRETNRLARFDSNFNSSTTTLAHSFNNLSSLASTPPQNTSNLISASFVSSTPSTNATPNLNTQLSYDGSTNGNNSEIKLTNGNVIATSNNIAAPTPTPIVTVNTEPIENIDANELILEIKANVNKTVTEIPITDETNSNLETINNQNTIKDEINQSEQT